MRRRLIDQVKAQNWVAAGVNLLLIVAGVFIALQISSWNDERKAAARVGLLTDQLHTDLQEEAWIAAYMLAYNREVLANARKAMDALNDDADYNDEGFLIAAYRASQYTWWNRRRAAFDELVAAGDIGDVGNAKLRSAAFYIYNSTLLDDIADRGAHSPYRDMVRMTLPTEVHDGLGAECGDRSIPMGDYASLDAILDYPCDMGAALSSIAAAAAALRAETALAPALRLRIATLETQLADLKEYSEVAQSALRLEAGGD